MLRTLKQWDQELFVWLNGLGIEDWDNLWLFITQLESWFVLFVYFFILLLHFYGAKKGAVLILSLMATASITLLITNFTKGFVARLRPNNVEVLADFIRILQNPANFSFFSGHASSSFAITTFVVLSLRKHHNYVYLFYVWPILFVLSRIYVGVHYPSDLFVGALVGMAIAFLVWAGVKKVFLRTSR